MPRQRPQKKPEPVPQTPNRVLPMQLRVGDVLVDETGEWEDIGRRFTTVGGKNANVRVRLIAQPTVTEIRMWSAHERITVTR